MSHDRRKTFLIAIFLAIAGGIAGAALVLAASPGAGDNMRASDVFAALSTSPATEAPKELTQVRSLPQGADLARVHTLGRSLGQFDSTLVMFPARDERSACYALLPANSFRGIGTVYCHPLGEIPQTAGDHFSVLTPETAVDGDYDVQVLGVAFDDVVQLRVQVDGKWRVIRIIHGNGFYLDLPGVRYEQLGQFEATLEDGTVQTHDFPDRHLAAIKKQMAQERRRTSRAGS